MIKKIFGEFQSSTNDGYNNKNLYLRNLKIKRVGTRLYITWESASITEKPDKYLIHFNMEDFPESFNRQDNSL